MSEIFAKHRPGAADGFPFPQLSLTTTVLVTALVFFWITGNGVLHAGLNPDDWRQLGRVPPEWGGSNGRWAMDLLYRFLFQARFVEPLQLVLAYGVFLYIAMSLARAAVGERYAGVAAIGIFLIGVNHPYMTDVLNFSAHVFGYPLALALSLAAFSIAINAWRRERLVFTGLTLVAAGQLLALALGFYPSFALFGLVLPAMALIRTDLVDHRQAARIVVSAAVVGLLGLAIYLLEWQAYRQFGHFYSQADLLAGDYYEFGAPSLDVILLKLENFGSFLKTVYGGALWDIRPANIFYEAMALLTAAAWGLAAFLDGLRGSSPADRTLSLLRRILGVVGAAVVIPTLFWFIYVDLFAPPRSYAMVGFTVPALLLTCVASIGASLPSRRGDQVMRWMGLAPTAIAAVVSVFVSAAMWNDQQRVAERDIAIATAIYGRLAALPGFDGKGFAIAGSKSDSALRWSVSVGWPVTEYSWAPNGLFRNLFGYPGRVDLVKRSPARCHAFPAADSVFLHDGRAFACLNDDPGFLPLSACEPVRGAAGVVACLTGPRRAVVKITGDCSRSAYRHFSTTGAKGHVADFTPAVRDAAYRDFANDVCYYELDTTDVGIAAVQERDGQGRLLWRHAFLPHRDLATSTRNGASGG